MFSDKLWQPPSNVLIVRGGIRNSILTPGGRGVSPGQPPPGPGGGGKGKGKGKAGSGSSAALDISIVQVTDKARVSNLDSVAQSFSVLPTAGNTIIVAGIAYTPGNPAASDITDNQGNSYSIAKSVLNPSHPGGITSWVAYANDISAPSGTFTVTYNPAGTAYMEIALIEAAGVKNGNPIGNTNSAASNETNAKTGVITAQAGSLLIACMSVAFGTTPVVSAGWTQFLEEIDNNNFQPGEADYRIVATAGSYEATWTIPPTGGNYGGVIVEFQS